MEIFISDNDVRIFLLVLIALPWFGLWVYIGWRIARRHDERQERAQFEPKEWHKRLAEWRRLQRKR